MKIIKFWVLTFLSFFLVSCNNTNIEQQLIVGTSADNPPYEFIQSGKIVGLDIDIINAIAKHLGKDVVIKNLDFNGLLAALSSNNVELLIAGLSITPERQVHVDFSQPYISAKVSVLYRTQDNFKNIEDLKSKTIGAQLGTIWGAIANDLSTDLHFKINSLSNNLMLVEELKSKVIDAIILEEAQCQKFIANNPELSYFPLKTYSSEFAIAMKKDSKLKSNIDKALIVLEKDGTLATIKKKWLGE
jgi:polar amino acid transport system substrate-binding protein